MENKKQLIDAKQAIAEMNRIDINCPYDDKEDILEKCVNLLCAAQAVDAVEVVHGHWINTPPYTASNGEYNKAQECSVCKAYFVSSGYTRYSNHPYCCECGAKIDGQIVWREDTT